MTQIVGFAGKKQSGKNTICNYIVAMKLAELQVAEKTKLGDSGDIYVSDILGERKPDCEWIEFSEKNMNIKKIFDDFLGSYVKIYGLADALKNICIEVFGLTNSQVYGADKDKNTLTHIKWSSVGGQTDELMTAREFLQYFGTDICRKIDSDVWINSLLRKVKSDSPELALICDVRFRNEIEALQKEGGIIIGLKRNMNRGNDSHASEKEIESCFEICDRVIDNQEASIKEQCEEAFEVISAINSSILPVVQK